MLLVHSLQYLQPSEKELITPSRFANGKQGLGKGLFANFNFSVKVTCGLVVESS